MVTTRQKFLFRLALLAALGSVALSAYVVAHAQTGPSWEVPVAIVEELRTFPRLSLVLAAVAVVIYFWAGRFSGINVRALRWFAIVLVLAFLYPLAIWLFEPAQWPFQRETLSSIALIQAVPVWIGAVVLLWLAGFRWLKDA